jgi:hypothetical protein
MPRINDELFDRLHAPSGRSRAGAARALGESGDPHAAQALLDTLHDSATEARRAAIEGLVALAWRDRRLASCARRAFLSRMADEREATVRAVLAQGAVAVVAGPPLGRVGSVGDATPAWLMSIDIGSIRNPPPGQRAGGAPRKPPPGRAKPRRGPRPLPRLELDEERAADDVPECGCEDCNPRGATQVQVDLPALSPVSPLARALAALRGEPARAEPIGLMGSRLAPTLVASLRARVREAPVALPEQVRERLLACGARWALALPACPPVIARLADLASAAALERCAVRLPELRLDGDALLDDASAVLAAPPDAWAAGAEWLAMALRRLASDAPVALVSRLFARRSSFHPEHRAACVALVPGALAHATRALATRIEQSTGQHVELGVPHVDLAPHQLGSSLMLELMAEASPRPVDLIEQLVVPSGNTCSEPRLSGHSLVPFLRLLLTGAGSLRRPDYPAFRLTTRPHVGLVPASAAAALVDLARGVIELSRSLLHLDAWSLLARHLRDPEGALFDAMSEADARALAAGIELHAAGYAALRREQPGAGTRIRRRHITSYQASSTERRAGPRAATLEQARALGLDLAKEGLVSALLDALHRPQGGAPAHRLKEACIALARRISLTHGLEQPALLVLDDPPALCEALLTRFAHAPLELAQALALGREGLPRLAGGHPLPEERAFFAQLRSLAGSRSAAALSELGDADPGELSLEQARRFTLRPLSREQALFRGELGRDCSTSSVPLRALSPHHVYYGVFDEERQLPGYITVFECWATTPTGPREPVLCLETINVPIPELDSAQEDLLLLLAAIADARGLSGLAVVTQIGTWNYPNQWVVRTSHRFRAGTPTCLSPADPALWAAYALACPHEAPYYSAFEQEGHHEGIRLLAPFHPTRCRVMPENLTEAERLRALPRARLETTSRLEDQAVGFITSLPAPDQPPRAG